MNRQQAVKANMKINWLLKYTDLQKQKIAKLVGVNNATVSRHRANITTGPHRRSMKLTEDEMANYLDFCESIEDLLGELYNI
jgi:hypothetical protein